jgi:putative endonuclease
MSNSREAGLQAEERALQFLQAQGLHCVARNFSSHRGEIDLVMQDSDTLVFVEVRFRRHGGFGSAAESVTGSKQQRIIRAASHFLNRSRQWRDSACRFDVLAISGAGQQTIDWIRDAFRADY